MNQIREDNDQQRRWVETDTQKRWPVSLPCQFYWQDKQYVGHLQDLSEKGAFLITPFVIPKGSKIRFTFWPRETEEFHLDIIVTHSGEYLYKGMDCPGMGGKFVEPHSATLLLLRQFLNQRAIQRGD